MTNSSTPNDNGMDRPAPVAPAIDGSIAEARVAAIAAVDGLADGAQALQQQAVSAWELAGRRVDELAHQSAQALHQGKQRLLDQAHAASSQTRHYIEREPVKAALIAAAAGAALMALVTLLARSRDRA